MFFFRVKRCEHSAGHYLETPQQLDVKYSKEKCLNGKGKWRRVSLFRIAPEKMRDTKILRNSKSSLVKLFLNFTPVTIIRLHRDMRRIQIVQKMYELSFSVTACESFLIIFVELHHSGAVLLREKHRGSRQWLDAKYYLHYIDKNTIILMTTNSVAVHPEGSTVRIVGNKFGLIE